MSPSLEDLEKQVVLLQTKAEKHENALNSGMLTFNDMSHDIKSLLTEASEARVQRDRIEEQTRKTNGRVTKIETEHEAEKTAESVAKVDEDKWKADVSKDVSFLKKMKVAIIYLMLGIAVASSDGPELITNLIELVK